MVEVVILAGGRGTRLRKILKDIPKPMAPIGGHPFLEYMIHFLKKFKIQRIILSTGYMSSTIESYFGNGKKWDVDIVYSYESQPLGTGGAIKKAAKLVYDEDFIVLNGDTLVDIDMYEFINFHRFHKAMLTMALVEVQDISEYGSVKVSSDKRITKFMEKNVTGKGIINGGIYAINRLIAESIPEGNISLEEEILPALAESKSALYGFMTGQTLIDIGTPDKYIELHNNPEKLYGYH